MRKILGLFFIFVFVIGLTGVCFAQLDEKKAQLDKIRKYLNVLDEKIQKARAAKKINKIAELKDLKRKELERAKLVRGEIDKLGKEKIAGKGKKAGYSGYYGKVGYGGGAGIVGGGYIVPQQNFDLLLGADLGIGSGYTIIGAQVSAVAPVSQGYAGLQVGFFNYSQTVADILGLSGNINSGGNLGVGIFGGMKVETVDVQIGYNSALGITAGAVYKF